MRGTSIAAFAFALLLAGCGGTTDTRTTAAPSAKPKPTLETRINVGALGFALDDFRSGTQTFLDGLNNCVQLADAGDQTSSLLCYRSARGAFSNQGAVVAISLDHLLAKAQGHCKTQLARVSKQFIAAGRSTISVANAILNARDVAALLDGLDRRLALVDDAFSRASNLCGGG